MVSPIPTQRILTSLSIMKTITPQTRIKDIYYLLEEHKQFFQWEEENYTRGVLVTSFTKRLPQLVGGVGLCLVRKRSTRSSSWAHPPMSLQKTLLEGEEAAKGRPQNNHWCFLPPWSFLTPECFPKAGITSHPPAEKVEQRGKPMYWNHQAL